MSHLKDKINLMEAADLAKRSPQDILMHAANGHLCVCIKTPKDRTVYITHHKDVSSARDIFGRNDFGYIVSPPPREVKDVSSLVLTFDDARDLCLEGEATVREFRRCFAWQATEKHKPAVLDEIRPFFLGYVLKLYDSNSKETFPSGVSYGKAVSLKIKRDDILFLREEIEAIRHTDIPVEVRLGKYRPLQRTSKKLLHLNEASTNFYASGNVQNLASSDISAWLEGKGSYSKTSAKLCAHFILADHNRKRGRNKSKESCDNYQLTQTDATKKFKLNAYTSTALALINELDGILSDKPLFEGQIEKWLKERNFNDKEIREIKYLVKSDENGPK